MSQLRLFLTEGKLNYFVILKNFDKSPTMVIVRSGEVEKLIEFFGVKDVIDVSSFANGLGDYFQYYFFIDDFCISFKFSEKKLRQLAQKHNFQIIKPPTS